MTPFLDTWCPTCRTWHSSVWVHLGNRMVKVNEVDVRKYLAQPEPIEDPIDFSQARPMPRVKVNDITAPLLEGKTA